MQSTTSVPSAEVTSLRQVAVLGTCTLAQATVAMATQTLAPLAGLVQADLGLSRSELGVLIAATSVGSMFVSLPSGWLTDTLGVRPMLALGLLCGGLLFSGAGFAPGYWQAYGLLLLAGLGLGFISPATTKAIMYWFPSRLRGTAMGLKQTGFPFGGFLAAACLPTLALFLAGWRATVVVVGLVVMAAGALSLWLYREHPLQHARQSGPRGPGFARIGRLVGDGRILRLAGFALFSCVAQSSLMGYLSLFLQESLALPIVVAGDYLALAQLGGAVGRVGWGAVSDRALAGRRRPVLLIAGGLAALMAVAVSTMAAQLPTALLAAATFLFGLGAIGWNGVYHTFVGEIAGRELAGTAIGFGLVASYVGVIVGPPVFGYLVDRTGSYAVAWGTQAAMFAIAGLLLINGVPDRAQWENA